MIDDYWEASDYANHASYVSQMSQQVMQDLAPKKGERILDLGCGDGELAKVMVDLGCEVIGVDTSQNLIDVARSRGVEARQIDAQAIDFESTFDAVFSNAALHWMPKQEELIHRVYRALKPGGRFVVEMGGQGNIAILCSAMTVALSEIGKDFSSRNPWVFPSPEEHKKLLTSAGFKVETITLRDRPTLLPTNVRGWFLTFTQEILSDLGESSRASVIKRMVDLCRPKLCDSNEQWTADYKRLNFVAIKEG
ncbi:trans-aconitate 2-methyltransferase [Moritella sp. 28]|uniref:class I SAM-dependent methyltransferase n=1 Tax=Moritella sp. 28 TaxID=2746232 RepID=UPI001BAA5E8C|nr:methyltransferase domain-containing protein [Moritella sp. 28]QUM86039.1 class I SAM-dependent methyltransferase [Moritella sp. 28]